MTICVHFGFNEVSSLEDFLLQFSIRFCAKDSHVVAVILEFRSTQKQIFGRVTPKWYYFQVCCKIVKDEFQIWTIIEYFQIGPMLILSRYLGFLVDTKKRKHFMKSFSKYSCFWERKQLFVFQLDPMVKLFWIGSQLTNSYKKGKLLNTIQRAFMPKFFVN
jgi:hypothetical protein